MSIIGNIIKSLLSHPLKGKTPRKRLSHVNKTFNNRIIGRASSFKTVTLQTVNLGEKLSLIV